MWINVKVFYTYIKMGQKNIGTKYLDKQYRSRGAVLSGSTLFPLLLAFFFQQKKFHRYLKQFYQILGVLRHR